MRNIWHDRATKRRAIVDLAGFLLEVISFFELVWRTPFRSCLVPEDAAPEFIAAASSHGNDCRTADLVEFGLVVLADDLELADRQLRKWIAL
jgi:hypothetical protein